MNFEDIVDMEWVDTHTTLENSGEYCFDYQPNFLLDQPVTPPPTTMIEPEIKMEPLTSMPTTEQIKQLIEIAKRQLALREQLAQQQQQTQETEQVLQEQPLFLSTQATEVQTAAPSTIFAPPPPVAPTSSTTPAMSTLSATTITSTDMTLPPLPPLLTDLEMGDQQQQQQPLSSKNSQTDTTTSSSSTSMGRRDSLASMTEESISLEAYAEADGIDLKKLTPKERRQLRNKISARNFRVRRKEYISTLEGQVNDHKMAAEALKEKLQKVEEENKKLRKEMDSLKRQNQILQQQQQKTPQSPRMIQKPNLNKDISILGTKATDSYRQQDNCILVSNAVMPVWDYKSILHQTIPPPRVPDYMEKCVGQFLYSVVQLASTMPRGTNQEQKPLLPDDRDFSSLNEKHHINASSSSYSLSSHLQPSSLPASYMEDLYDFLIQSALINSSNTDKSFWWWQSQTM